MEFGVAEKLSRQPGCMGKLVGGSQMLSVKLPNFSRES